MITLRAYIDEAYTPPENCFCFPCPSWWGHRDGCEYAASVSVEEAKDTFPKTGNACLECGEPQHITPVGVMCRRGHRA